jgi:hypothetical protein
MGHKQKGGTISDWGEREGTGVGINMTEAHCMFMKIAQ